MLVGPISKSHFGFTIVKRGVVFLKSIDQIGLMLNRDFVLYPEIGANFLARVYDLWFDVRRKSSIQGPPELSYNFLSLLALVWNDDCRFCHAFLNNNLIRNHRR